jgi:hypothetical protein
MAAIDTTHPVGCPCLQCAKKRATASAEYLHAWEKLCKVAKYHATVKNTFTSLFTEDEATQFRVTHGIGQPRLYAPDHVFTAEQISHFIQNGSITPGGGSSPKTPKQSDNGKTKNY